MNGDSESQLLDEEELEKAKMRPADIDQDMKEMGRRKRVDAVMTSSILREELERIVEAQIQQGVSGYQALQNISELMGIPSKTTNSAFQGVIPINDIRGMETLSYAKGEKNLRCKLAAMYRLIAMHEWSQSIYNHVTARISQDTEHFLLNPFGLLYQEVTASSLVKIDMQGNAVDPGTTNFGVNLAGVALHSAIHAARPDIKCIVHLHHPAVIAVGLTKDGLLPLTQESCLIGDISYYNYSGLFLHEDQKENAARCLGPVNKILMLRNHGVAVCGESIEEAWHNLYNLVRACEAQLKMTPLGLDNLMRISDEDKQAAYEAAKRGVDSKQDSGSSKDRKYKIGEMEFEALMRSMDNAGLRTGYTFKRPLVKAEPSKMTSDVALPPTASNYSHLFEEDEFGRSPLKRFLDGKKTHEKTKWLNSPNVYQKVELMETGTSDPKKITKWVADGSPTHSNAVKVEDPLQFVPTGTNPKEFKKIQKMIKENRRVGNITSGPTSHLLDGVGPSWDEARRMQDASMTTAGDQVILVGAASKGIIQRDFQHNAVVYKTPYAKNPFDAISDQDIEEYRQSIERKQRGDPEEIQINQMKIGPETAIRDVVIDGQDPKSPMSDDDGVTNGDHHSDEADARDTSQGDSLSKDAKKKKKKGIRTPSFLKKKKDKKKEKQAQVAAAAAASPN